MSLAPQTSIVTVQFPNSVVLSTAEVSLDLVIDIIIYTKLQSISLCFTLNYVCFTGKMNFEEFCAMVESGEEEEESTRQAFAMFDKNGKIRNSGALVRFR